MSDKSRIEWTESTWNPTTGCTKVSQGCKHCYAERDWSRLVHLPAYQGREFTDVACHPERLDQPLRWRKPRRIFVNSMSDLFHESVPDQFIAQVFAVMAATSEHTYQVLTKRPERMLALLYDPGFSDLVDDLSHIHTHSVADWPIPNVWLGVSVEDQATADQRIPLLLQTPAAVRWLSAEPLLGPVDIRLSINRLPWRIGGGDAGLHWVVAGGESGPKARPSHPDWFRSLRDQCKAAGAPFLFKQWGEWSPLDAGEGPYSDCAGVLPDGDAARYSEGYRAPWDSSERLKQAGGVRLDRRILMWRVGKKAAGRLLDGVLHDEYPA